MKKSKSKAVEVSEEKEPRTYIQALVSKTEQVRLTKRKDKLGYVRWLDVIYHGLSKMEADQAEVLQIPRKGKSK